MAFASPEATRIPLGGRLVDQCEGVAPYIPCRQNSIVGEGAVGIAWLDSDLLQGRNLSLYRWSLGSQVIESSGFETADNVGFAVDIVERGAYRATFTADVVVYRSEVSEVPGADGFYRSLFDRAAGEVVELSRGDSVTYPLGTRDTVQSAFEGPDSELYVSTIVLAESDQTVLPLESGATLVGSSLLPMSLPEMMGGQVTDIAFFKLLFSEIRGEPTFPETSQFGDLLLGPIYSSAGRPEFAYMIWVQYSRG